MTCTRSASDLSTLPRAPWARTPVGAQLARGEAHLEAEERPGGVEGGDPGHPAQPQLLHLLGQEAHQVRPQTVAHQLQPPHHGPAQGLRQQHNCSNNTMYTVVYILELETKVKQSFGKISQSWRAHTRANLAWRRARRPAAQLPRPRSNGVGGRR